MSKLNGLWPQDQSMVLAVKVLPKSGSQPNPAHDLETILTIRERCPAMSMFSRIDPNCPIMIGGFWAHVGVVDITGEIIEILSKGPSDSSGRVLFRQTWLVSSDLATLFSGNQLPRTRQNSSACPHDTLAVDGRESPLLFRAGLDV